MDATPHDPQPSLAVRLTSAGFVICYQGADRDWYPVERSRLARDLPAKLHPRGDGAYSSRHVATEARDLLEDR